MGHELDLAVRRMSPHHRDFLYCQTPFTRHVKKFDVEAEIKERLLLKKGGTAAQSKEFEAALGVAIGKAGQKPNALVEDLPTGFPPPRLVNLNVGSLHIAGPEGNVTAAFDDFLLQLGEFLNRRT